MKTLKQIIKETVAEPKSPDEKRFKELHTKNVKVTDAPGAGSKANTKKKPRPADYDAGQDETAYDTSYESVDINDFLTIDEENLEAELEGLSEEQLDELIGTAARLVGAATVGAKKVAGAAKKVKSRFSAGGRADALEKRARDIKKRKKDQERLRKARQNLRKVRSEEVDIAEDAWEEIPMMQRQLKFMQYAAQSMMQYLQDCDDGCVDPEEWFQNKLAHMHGQMKGLYAYTKGESMTGGMGMNEEVEDLQEAGKIACLECDEVSTAAAWKKKGGFCPKCKTSNQGVAEEVELDESVIKDLEKIVSSKSAKDIKFSDGDTMKVDMQTANLLMKLYGALNDKNKKRVADTLGKDEAGFMKIVDFAWSKAK